jgi:hypothetical protein
MNKPCQTFRLFNSGRTVSLNSYLKKKGIETWMYHNVTGCIVYIHYTISPSENVKEVINETFLFWPKNIL